jgi:hypothetical protein
MARTAYRLDMSDIAIPEERRVARLAATLTACEPTLPGDRVGGFPTAWSDSQPWPMCARCDEPMAFILQLIGTKAGGRIDLGDWHALQLFLCGLPQNDCGAYDPHSGCNAPILRSGLAEGTRTPPVSAAVEAAARKLRLPGQTLTSFQLDFAPSFDDRIFESDEYGQPLWPSRIPGVASTCDATIGEEEVEAAFERAFTCKVGGILAAGHTPQEVKCRECGAAMAFFAQFPGPRVECYSMGGQVVLHRCPAWHEMAYQTVRGS